MPAKFPLPIPVMRALRKLGSDINTARRRRRIPMELLAERAGITRTTLSKIEKGDPSSSIGSYAAVLFALGLSDNIAMLADTEKDTVGRQLDEETLPRRVTIKRKKTVKKEKQDGGE